jgi:hypothetical protein
MPRQRADDHIGDNSEVSVAKFIIKYCSSSYSCWATEKEQRKSMKVVIEELRTFANDYFDGINVNQEMVNDGYSDDDPLLPSIKHRCVSLFKRVCCSMTQNDRYSTLFDNVQPI